jgi:hypothetical protein
MIKVKKYRSAFSNRSDSIIMFLMYTIILFILKLFAVSLDAFYFMLGILIYVLLEFLILKIFEDKNGR